MALSLSPGVPRLRFLEILRLVGPFVLASVGVPLALVPVIVEAIGTVEHFTTPHPHTGAEKKAHVLEAVNLAVTAVNTVKPGTVVSGYADAVSQGIDSVVAIANLIQRQRLASPPALNMVVAPS